MAYVLLYISEKNDRIFLYGILIHIARKIDAKQLLGTSLLVSAKTCLPFHVSGMHEAQDNGLMVILAKLKFTSIIQKLNRRGQVKKLFYCICREGECGRVGKEGHIQ